MTSPAGRCPFPRQALTVASTQELPKTPYTARRSASRRVTEREPSQLRWTA